MGRLDIQALRQQHTKLSRRTILQALATLSLGPGMLACSQGDAPDEAMIASTDNGGELSVQFLHGVASGDPYAESVVLWTRVTPSHEQAISVHWAIYADEDLNDEINSGLITTDARRDFTVKLVAHGLQPYRHYWYQFKVADTFSPVGRTKTAPTAATTVDHLRFAISSCALFSFGYFNAYGGIARQDDLDVVFSLGDYIYEYGADELFGTAVLPGRKMQPAHQTVSLDDYRIRYALYRTDTDLQAAHAQHPWICTWDDHETANNSYDDGAANHDPAVDGPWDERKRAAIQAYFEWLPVRDEFNPNTGGHLYRRFEYGNLIDFFVLDTRLQGRDQPVSRGTPDDPQRMMMSSQQEHWLIQQLRASKAQWKFIAQQTMMTQLDVVPGVAFLPDSWSGYSVQRDRLLDAFGGQDGGPAIDNVVVLSGDIHMTFCNELTQNPRDRGRYTPGTAGSVGVEFVCTSVTTPLSAPIVTDQVFRLSNPNIRYSEGTSDASHGYTVFDVASAQVEAHYHYPLSILLKTDYERIQGPFRVRDGRPYIEFKGLLL